MTLDEISQILVEIRADVKVMKHDLGADYKLLHGNGQPGLLEKHNEVVRRVDKIETSIESMKDVKKSHVTIILAIVGHVIAIGAATVAFLK